MNPDGNHHHRRHDRHHHRLRKRRKRNTSGRVIGIAAIVVSAIFFVVPFIFILLIASKPVAEANLLEFSWPSNFVLFDNLAQAFAARDYLMIIAFINSVILTVVSVAAMVIFSAMVAYVWQRRASRLNPVISGLILAGLIVPPAIVPTIWVLQGLGLFKTMPGLILIEIAYGFRSASCCSAPSCRRCPGSWTRPPWWTEPDRCRSSSG